MIVSIIDIGTKSLKHYIFRLTNTSKERLHYKRYSEANLGGEENISQETEARILSIVSECLKLNEVEQVDKLKIVGTEVFRKSEQARELAKKIKDFSKTELEILDQDREAYYLYYSFIDSISLGNDFAAVNIGGGSTEIVMGDAYSLKYSQELPFGVNFLKNTFGQKQLDWPRLDKYLDENIISYVGGADVLFVTGVLDFLKTVAPSLGFNFEETFLTTSHLSLSIYDYHDLVMKLRETPVETLRSFYPIDPDFANNVAIGQSVYLRVAEKLGVKVIIPSNNDLTDGIVKEMERNY